MHTYEIVKFLRYMTNYFLPCIFWIMIIFSFDTPYMAILTILTAGIHELGHISAIIFFRNEGRIPKGRITGFRINVSGTHSYKSEIIILLAGPLFNIIVFLLALPFSSLLNGYLNLFIILNLATAMSNLIPAEGYDGYCALKKYFEYKAINPKPLESLSFAVTALFCFLYLYLILKYACGFWIFSIFFLSLLSKISKTVNSDFF